MFKRLGGSITSVPFPFHAIAKVTLLSALFAAAVLLLAQPMPAQAQTDEDLSPELERRAQTLYREIMCPTCVGQTIHQSQAPIATNMRAIVRERLAAGYSDQEILAFFVDAYGESVLASPPREGVGMAAWIIPPVALALGGGAVFLAIRSLRRPLPESVRERMAYTQPAEDRNESLDSYLRLVDEELKTGERTTPRTDDRDT